MSAFSDDCREKAARYAERAAGYRLAGDKSLGAYASDVAIKLSSAAAAISALEFMEKQA